MIDELTVFVISCGDNPNFQHCLDALDKQTVKFTLEIIKDYRPMSRAFQEMIDRCKTPYYIQVDEDMILNSNAIEAMYKELKNTPPTVAMYGFRLRDVHLNTIIYGIKIYRHDVFKKYPYNLSHPSCEVEQLDRMKADGYDYKLSMDIVGDHSPYWTEEAIFERYYNLMQKFKIYHYVWMESVPKKLVEILKNDFTDVNLYALFGAFAGIIEEQKITGEKDFMIKPVDMRKMSTFMKGPIQSTLYVTSKCNFKCKFCYRQHHEIEQFPDMTIDTLAYFFKKLPTVKSACICGYGDPLMCSTLPQILEYLNSIGIYVGLITNGSMLKESMRYLLLNPPKYISVSLNAHNPQLHRDVTGTDTFQSVIEGIRAVLNDGTIPLYVTTVLTKKNYGTIPDFLKFAKGLGIKNVYLHNILPHYDHTAFWEDALQFSDIGIIDDIKHLPDADIVKKYPMLIDRSGGLMDCYFPWRSIAVNGNGSVSPCNSVIPCDKKFGNIKDFVIWNNEPMCKFRDDYLNNNIPECKMCFRHWKCE